MLLPGKTVTEKQVAANKGNAQKSTGPTTPRGKRISSQNGFKHGLYSQLQFDVMDALREDPAERRRTIDNLIQDYHPENTNQQMVVEEIGTLHWRRGQLERSQNAQMGERVHDLEAERDRLHLQIHSDVADISQAEMLEKGLRNLQDCPAKFEMLLDKFNALIKQVEECNYSDAVPYLTAIYAKQASVRGASIYNRFLTLMRLERERAEALKHRRPWPPPGDEVFDDEDAPRAEDEPGYDPRLDRPDELLLHNLTQELHDVTKLYGMYIRDKVMLTQMKRDAALAPHQPAGYYLAREIWMVDRDIDAKTRLFMKMRVEDRKWRQMMEEDEEGEREAGESAKPAGSVGSPPTASVGPSSAGPEADPGSNDAPDGKVGPSGARPEADPGSNDAPDGKVGPSGAGPEPDQTADAEEPTVAGPAVSVDPCSREQTHGSVSAPKAAIGKPASGLSKPKRQIAKSDRGSSATTPTLIIVACVLSFMLGMRARSLVRTLSQTQGYVKTQRHVLECSSVATALPSSAAVRARGGRASIARASAPTLAAKGAGAAIALGSVFTLWTKYGRASTATASVPTVPAKGGSLAGALQGWLRPQRDKPLARVKKRLLQWQVDVVLSGPKPLVC